MFGLLILSKPTWAAPTDICTGPDVISVHCGRTPSAIFNGEQLLVVFEQDDVVYFTTSDDQGTSYNKAVAINHIPEGIYTNGENRPKIVLGHKGQIYVSWSKVTEGRFNGDIRFSRSLDNGKSFSAVKTINDDNLQTTHRFESMQVDESGDIYLSWIDKRDRVKTRAKGLTFTGASIYYAVSLDDGASFKTNSLVQAHSCECCRIASTPLKKGVAIFWRHIFEPNLRDHAFAVLGTDGISNYQRATSDNWALDACPHHGPSIKRSKGKSETEQKYHVTWFTNGSTRQGIFYGQLDQEGEDPKNIKSISDNPSAGHPDLALNGSNISIVWKEFDGKNTLVNLLESNTEGQSWVASTTLASTADKSDHPYLLQSDKTLYLSWKTLKEGYRVIPIGVKSAK